MALHHSIMVETEGLITKFVSKKLEKKFNPLEDWPERITDLYDDTTVFFNEKPTHVHDIEETEQGWNVTVKIPISINKCVITSDDEYKAWRLIDWEDEISQGDIQVKPLCKESFDVVEDQHFWVEDEEFEE